MRKLLLLALILVFCLTLAADTKVVTPTQISFPATGDNYYSQAAYGYGDSSGYYGPAKSNYGGTYSSWVTIFTFNTNIGSTATITSATLRLSFNVQSLADNLSVAGQWNATAWFLEPSATAFSAVPLSGWPGYMDITVLNLTTINKLGNTKMGIGLVGTPYLGTTATTNPGATLTIVYTLPGGSKPRVMVINDSD
ncbi:MAG: hypothetical protein J0H49_10620 [Acidobacteria bacterium]|nr:hypothetical protein [Acidobacteriota bacterium]